MAKIGCLSLVLGLVAGHKNLSKIRYFSLFSQFSVRLQEMVKMYQKATQVSKNWLKKAQNRLFWHGQICDLVQFFDLSFVLVGVARAQILSTLSHVPPPAKPIKIVYYSATIGTFFEE